MAYKSNFNYIYKKEENSWIFFNTLTGALIILDDHHKNIYDKIPNKNISVNNEFTSSLLDLGFINDDSFNDIEIVNHARKNNAYNSKSSYLRILTTTGCNARCYYCYEHGFEKKQMSIDTSEQLIKYILSLPKLEKFYIHWFGGEPLLNMKIIDNVMNGIYDKLIENGTKIYVYFTSNGSLVTKDVAKKSKEKWHANWFQITIDDLDDKYNYIKNYIDKKYNFELVIKNIGYLLENHIKVILRINYSVNESDKVIKVIDFLYNKYKRFCDEKLLIFSPAPIFNICNNRVVSIKEQKVYNLFEPNKYLIDKGLLNFNDAYGLNFKGGQCYACHHNSFVVDPEGNLYKCTVTIKEKETCVGSIYNGVDKNKYYHKWVDPKLPQKCNKCVFLPICQGGCRAGYLGYMDVCCKRIIKEINEILNYKVSLNLLSENKITDKNEIYLD